MTRFVLVAFIVALVGCNEEENKTVEYFTTNPAERADVLAKCEALDATEAEANCVNARTAQNIADSNENLDAARQHFGD